MSDCFYMIKKKCLAVLKRLLKGKSRPPNSSFSRQPVNSFLAYPSRNCPYILKLCVQMLSPIERPLVQWDRYTDKWRFFLSPGKTSCKRLWKGGHWASFSSLRMVCGEGSNLKTLLLLEKLCRFVQIMEQAYKSLLQLQGHKEKFISSPTCRALHQLLFITGLRAAVQICGMEPAFV